MSSAAAGLDTLATGLADCQSRIAWCRQRIDALELTDGDLPDDVRPLVQAIKTDADAARDDHDRHLRRAGATFDGLTSSVRYADPPGFFGMVARAFDKIVELNVEFAIGIVEGVWEMVKGVCAIGAILVQPHKWDDALRTLDQIIQYAVSDPGGFLKTMGQAIVDWDTLMSNPARWAGKLVPAILERPFDVKAQSRFVTLHPTRELSPRMIERLHAVDVDRLRARLLDAGLPARAVDDALDRLADLRAAGRFPDNPPPKSWW
jgi:hypothetical protein